jgi:hypothetical protein
MAFLGFFFTFTLVLHIGLGFSALRAALVGIPVAAGITSSAALFSRLLLPKLGARVMSVGAVLIAIGLVLISLAFSHYGLAVKWYELLPGLLIFGLGMGMLFGAIFAVLYNDIDSKFAGAASGLQNTFQQIAGAIGIAIIGVVFFGAISGHAVASFGNEAPELKQKLTAAHIPPPAQAQIISGVKRCFKDRSSASDPSATPKSCKHAKSNKKIGALIASAAKTANAKNFTRAFRLSTYYDLALLAIAFILSFLLPKHLKHPEASPEIG